VRVAGIDGQGLHPVALQVKLVDHNRCRLHLVGREHAACIARVCGVDHTEIVLLAARHGRRAGGEGLDPARRRPGPKPSGVGHGHCTGPSSPVFRSKPKAMLKHSTPCPEAPLTRLSIAAVTTALRPCAATLTRQRFECVASLVAGVWSITLVKGWPA